MIQIANGFGKLEIFNRYSDVILDSASTSPEQFKKFIHETKDWFEFEIKVKEKRIQILYNQKVIADTIYNEPIGNLMGIESSFVGTGEIDYIRVYDREGTSVMREEF